MHAFDLGIRREDKNIWERRVPLTPAAVRALVADHGLRVAVESSDNRIFADQEYADAGATVVDDAMGARIVLAVKEIPASLLREGGTYMYFSHTTKRQAYNMPMLRTLVERGCSLLDYEHVVDQGGRRLIFFSWHAGAAGMVDTLHVAGRRLAWNGLESPLLEVQPTWRYGSLEAVAEAMAGVARRVKAGGIPAPLAPFVVGITGYGNVSRGAQHVLDQLPVQEVSPEDLASLRSASSPARDRIFKVVFREEHMVAPRDGRGPFDVQDYFTHPENYAGIFPQYAVHLDVMVNGIFWAPRYPRLLDLETLRSWWSSSQEPRLQVVGDVSCDVGGSVESLLKVTSPDEPAFVYDPLTGDVTDGVEGRGLVMMAVDNLPCELSLDASQSFSDALAPFVPSLAGADLSAPGIPAGLAEPLKRALILYRGGFTTEYGFMKSFIE